MKTIIVTFSLLWTLCHSLSITCLHNSDGRYYSGNISITASGALCLPWIQAKDEFSLNQLNINSYHDNFCRNPNRSESTWCYTGSNQTERCGITVCPANPKASYCIVIPRIHFTVCPILFSKSSHFQTYGLNLTVFCCVSNGLNISKLLPKDACLIVVIRADAVKDSFTTCPAGFHSQPIVPDVVESNIIYKCCQSRNTTYDVFKEVRRLQTDGDVGDKMAPIFAHLSPPSVLCSHLGDIQVHTVEYHHMDQSSNHILPKIVTVCYYYPPTTSGMRLKQSQLGLMSTKDCPPNFHRSNGSSMILKHGSVKMNLCIPNDPSYDYSSGNVCLLSTSVVSSLYLCPHNFQIYDVVSAIYEAPLPRFCCKDQSEEVDYNLGSIVMSNLTTLSFVVPSGRCPTYNAIRPVNGILATIMIQFGPVNHVSGRPITDLELLTCYYDLHDLFAYRKIGQLCPAGMTPGNSTYRCNIQESNDICQIEYCVGSVISADTPLPRGNYCLYKVRRQCPLGFQDHSGRNIIPENPLVADNDMGSLCCHNDPFNQTNNSYISFPFVNSNKTSSFGLLLLNNYDLCPAIYDFISHIDVDVDGTIYCAYRSKEEDYLWRNDIIWPQTPKQSMQYSKIIPSMVDQYWEHITKTKYQSSVVYKYPLGRYCVLSQGPCKSINVNTIMVKYPIKGFYICCDTFDELSTSWGSRGKQLIGYMAPGGKCSSVEHNAIIVHDIFEIEESRFNKSYGIDLIKIGVVPDFHARPSFIKVDFQFCISEIKDEENDKDQLNSVEFIRPSRASCPIGFRDIEKNIFIDSQDQLDPLSRHFVAKHSLSLCLPMKQIIRNGIFPFCGINLGDCWSEDNINLNSTIVHQPIRICCSNTITHRQTIYTKLSQFSLPLHPSNDICPKIANHSSLKWKLLLPEIQHRLTITLCFYYTTAILGEWPPGNYLTIAYNKQCPSGFVLIDYNGTDLCTRTKDDLSKSSIFPDGNYCVLTFINTSCPSTGSWHSKKDLIGLGKNILNICCSTSSRIILNIPLLNDTVFSFLAMEKCSFIPGTVITQLRFLSFRMIIQCLYRKTECDERSGDPCMNKGTTMEGRSNAETRHNIIIGLLISILSVTVLIVVIFIVHSRFNMPTYRSCKVEDMKLSAIYTAIDPTTDYGDDGIPDEDTTSAYSIA